MSYVILKTNGTILTTINDGTINTTSTSIGLPGRLYPGYGQVMDTNFVHVLENFADAVPPANPLQGQLWFDTSNASPGSAGVLKICPSDGEANALNWYTVLTTASASSNIAIGNVIASGNISANNVAATNNVTANLASFNYLTVNVQANIANANVTGNAKLANVLTNNITTGSYVNQGNIDGAWTLTGSATLNGKAGTAMWVTGGNLLTTGIKTDNFYYSNGDVISFGGTYSNSNVASYLPTYSGAFGLFGGGATFNGNTLTTGSNTTNGTITGNWTLSTGSTINGLTGVSGANIVGPVASATSATTAGTVTNPIQPNITQVGTLSSLTSSGVITAQRFSATVATGTAPLTIQSTTKVANLNADLLDGYDTDINVSPTSIVVRDPSGNVNANYFIGNGAFLTGLSFGSVSQISNGTSNVSVASAGGNVTISISGTSNVVTFSNQGINVSTNISANNISANRLAGSLTTGAQPNITSVGTLTSLDSSGNINGANITVTTGAFYGNGAGLTNIPSSAIVGGTPSSNYATYAGVVTIGAQPNITSVNSAFNSLSFAANANITLNGTASQITGANLVSANFFQGNGSRLSSINGANVTGTVANASYATSAGSASTATSATTSGTVTTAAQPNITSVGSTLSIGGSQAVKISDFTQSLNSPGYTKLPNGLLMQWGYAGPYGTGTHTLTYPVPFSSAPYTMQTTEQSYNAASNKKVTVYTLGTTSATMNVVTDDSGSYPSTISYYWFAVGPS